MTQPVEGGKVAAVVLSVCTIPRRSSRIFRCPPWAMSSILDIVVGDYSKNLRAGINFHELASFRAILIYASEHITPSKPQAYFGAVLERQHPMKEPVAAQN